MASKRRRPTEPAPASSSRLRDGFADSTRELLAKRVAYQCSNPLCRRPTVGPRDIADKTINIGVAAHITAASPNGPRYDPCLTSAERRSAANGIWLCQNCAKLIDNDVTYFTIDLLKNWKKRAEDDARLRLERPHRSDSRIVAPYLCLQSQIERGGRISELFLRHPEIAAGRSASGSVVGNGFRKLMYDEVEDHADSISAEDFEFIADSLPDLLESGGIDTLPILFNFVDVLIETRAHHAHVDAGYSTQLLRTLDTMAKRTEISSGLMPAQRLPYLELLATAASTFGSDLLFPRYVKAAKDLNLLEAPPSELSRTFIWHPAAYYGNYQNAVGQLRACLENPNYSLAHGYQALLLAATEGRSVSEVIEDFGIDVAAAKALGAFRSYKGESLA